MDLTATATTTTEDTTTCPAAPPVVYPVLPASVAFPARVPGSETSDLPAPSSAVANCPLAGKFSTIAFSALKYCPRPFVPGVDVGAAEVGGTGEGLGDGGDERSVDLEVGDWVCFFLLGGFGLGRDGNGGRVTHGVVGANGT
jgi:hypothetical protein